MRTNKTKSSEPSSESSEESGSSDDELEAIHQKPQSPYDSKNTRYSEVFKGRSERNDHGDANVKKKGKHDSDDGKSKSGECIILNFKFQ